MILICAVSIYILNFYILHRLSTSALTHPWMHRRLCFQPCNNHLYKDQKLLSQQSHDGAKFPLPDRFIIMTIAKKPINSFIATNRNGFMIFPLLFLCNFYNAIYNYFCIHFWIYIAQFTHLEPYFCSRYRTNDQIISVCSTALLQL